MAMLPTDQLVKMVPLTSAKLIERRMGATTRCEVLKFMAILVFATRYEFGVRAELWATKARTQYMIAPALGQNTGMPRARFDALWSCLRFSQRTGTAGNESEANRWSLINDYVASINTHRPAHVSPSELICVDESMSKWYGRGGRWILRGLPMYVAIDRLQERGCEIQNGARGRSGIMLRVHVVTTAEYHQATVEEGERAVNHPSPFTFPSPTAPPPTFPSPTAPLTVP